MALGQTDKPMLETFLTGSAPVVLPLSVEQFHKMAEAGILSDGEPVELVDGILLRIDRGGISTPMMHSSRHAAVVTNLGQVLYRAIQAFGCHVRSQLPVTLSTYSEPEPDVAVVRGKARDYMLNHPGPSDVLLVVEVAESSLSFDRKTKQRLYAQAGIEEYWIVNLSDDLVEVYTSPRPGESAYADCTRFGPGETVHFKLTGGLLPSPIAIAISEILTSEAD